MRDAGEHPGEGVGLVQAGQDHIDVRGCGRGHHGSHPTSAKGAFRTSVPYETRTSAAGGGVSGDAVRGRPHATAVRAGRPCPYRSSSSPRAVTRATGSWVAFFLQHPNRAYSREDLMREVWGRDFGDLSTVTVHVRRLARAPANDAALGRVSGRDR
ncbi:winged helix-turn-helix domain-containing protein [Streptomyces sp. NPDC007917]|uniref:winged helix-turn-helix domain-containing protein n=1 Tax=Streptomyces sp. NPDC007917 TaxID=3364793 RepID=UPI0036EBFFEF